MLGISSTWEFGSEGRLRSQARIGKFRTKNLFQATPIQGCQLPGKSSARIRFQTEVGGDNNCELRSSRLASMAKLSRPLKRAHIDQLWADPEPILSDTEAH